MKAFLQQRVRFILFVLLLLGIIVISKTTDIGMYLNPTYIRTIIDTAGTFGPVVFIVVYATMVVLLLPALPMTLLAGVLFGPIYGTMWVSVGSTSGAMLAFLLARFLGESFVRRFLHEKFPKLETYDERLRLHGFRTVIILRLIPLFPFTASSFVLGLTRVKFWQFALGTFIGALPWTYVYAAFGEAAVTLNWKVLVLSLGILLYYPSLYGYINV